MVQIRIVSKLRLMAGEDGSTSAGTPTVTLVSGLAMFTARRTNLDVPKRIRYQIWQHSVGLEMIISYRHNFIFIRTRKTASSTIETVLRDCLGPDDIFVGQNALLEGQSNAVASAWEKGPENVAGHMKAEEIAAIVPEQFWNQCYKFTSERHPYEKAVSLAFYNFGRREIKGKKTPRRFPRFLDKIVRKGSYRGYDHYTVNGKVVVDDFVRHETLLADLKRIGERLGIPVPSELPQKKSVYRSDRRPAREILSEQQKHTVFEICREEFELLGYQS